jgi:UDP-2-acetamido-2,6-beta-L-arabino-hexul-4-ose reductase
MKKIGITGDNGFIGSHLKRFLNLFPKKYKLVSFERGFFENQNKLDNFVENCDCIFHLAGVNRSDDVDYLYRKNIQLSEILVDSLIRTNFKGNVVMSSSSQEDLENSYGNSKKIAREKLKKWSEETNNQFSGLIIPNVYGPFCKPFYNSVIATFCYQINNNQEPKIQIDKKINFIYIDNLVSKLVKTIDNDIDSNIIEGDFEIQISDILIKLNKYKSYNDDFLFPDLVNKNDLNLFNTFRSYIDLKNNFPRSYKSHNDDRGSFTELIKSESQGQVSFSTTKPGITRGNHLHTRKVERFIVLNGEALIQLRKIDSKEVLEFKLSGEKLEFIDMPIWYTHNIKNIGDGELITLFWINEFFDPKDPDTYFKNV